MRSGQSTRTSVRRGQPRRLFVALILSVTAVTGCATDPVAEAAPRHVAAPTTSPPPVSTTAEVVTEDAVAAAEGAAAPSTELGVAVLDRTTGDIAAGARGDEPFYTASVSKVVVAVDILDRRRSAGLVVSDDDLDLIRRALGPSDDDAMNVLWTRFDGPGAAARVSAGLGLQVTSAPEDLGQWGEMSTSAADLIRVYRYVLDGMPAADRNLLITSLAAAPATAADGFDQAFGLLAPEVRTAGGPDTIAKQGWMCCFTGQYYLHSAGAVDDGQRFVVVLLSRIPRGPGWEAARAELTTVADAAVGALTRS